jgi:hypothetical protein
VQVHFHVRSKLQLPCGFHMIQHSFKTCHV